MKSIEFGEEGLKNLAAIGQSLFEDENDPTSIAYKRVIVRPKINWFKIILKAFIPLALAGILAIAMHHFGIHLGIAIFISTVLFLGYCVLNLKAAIICVVRLYQKFAPESIRRKCRFEPSCSEYMILAIEKYGLKKGLSKGIDRLRRCNINDGGYDMP